MNMKSWLYLLTTAFVTMAAFSCTSSSNYFGEEGDNGFSNIGNGSGSESGIPTDAGDIATFDIAIDSTALSETETIPIDDEDYLENNTFGSSISIKYEGNTASISGTVEGVTISTSGAHVNVTSTVKGVMYILSGTTTDGSFKMQSSEKKFEIQLNGVSITNPNGAAINSQSGKRVYVDVVDGTFNYLADGSNYTIPDGEDMKGTIFSEGELLFSGKGSLRILANAKAGISSDDYILFRPGNNIYVNASSGNGISANDAVIIKGGVINVETSGVASKGISCDGYIEIDGGRTTTITTGTGEYDSEDQDISCCSGIKSDSIFTINEGVLFCKSSGKGGKGISCDQKMEIKGGTVKIITTGSTFTYGNLDSKAKGIKTDGDLEISGGDVTVRTTGGDGSEGIESKSILTISNGNVKVYAYDDAINSASHLYIKGGTIYTFSSNNDGLDSNGNTYIQGGNTVAYGTTSPECGIDANEEGGYHVIITGGTLIGVGGGTSYPYSSSTQPSIVYGGSVSSGSVITINDSNSSALISFTMGRSYNSSVCFLFTSPDLKTGNSYTVNVGGSSAATISSLSSPYSSVGSTSGNIGGGNQPGGRW